MPCRRQASRAKLNSRCQACENGVDEAKSRYVPAHASRCRVPPSYYLSYASFPPRVRSSRRQLLRDTALVLATGAAVLANTASPAAAAISGYEPMPGEAFAPLSWCFSMSFSLHACSARPTPCSCTLTGDTATTLEPTVALPPPAALKDKDYGKARTVSHLHASLP